MAKDRSRVLNKYRNRVAGAAQEYADGVANPKADWLNSYTKAQPRMQAGIQKAIAEGRMVKGANKSGGTSNWQAKAQGKGARNYTQSADDAAKGYEGALDKVLGAGDAARQAVANMPDTTIEQRIARAAAAMKAISDYHKK